MFLLTLVSVSAVLLWIAIIHIGLSDRHHPALRIGLVLAVGALFWGFDLGHPQTIPHNLMWVAPTVGLTANLWARIIKMDGRVIISAVIGVLMTCLFIWAIVPARAADKPISATYQLPIKEQSVESAGLPGAPPISADFLRKIRGQHQ